MRKKIEHKVAIGKLPMGVMCWTCCAECPASEPHGSSSDKLFWCGKYSTVKKGSDGCSSGPNR